jgi:pimeloyl-ACP methyl ester carboxylesterase
MEKNVETKVKKKITIPIDNQQEPYLTGNLIIIKNSKSLVIFAHGSGSGMMSPRNQYVSEILNNDGVSTLLLNLLTAKEDKIDTATRNYRFDIKLLSNRLIQVTDWLMEQESTMNMFLGYFGASTGAAAALIAADKRAENVSAIVSRGGRVDLSLKHTDLKEIVCPTLFIVGEKDEQVIEWNKQVINNCLENVKNKKMIIIPGASHLFEEPGKIDEVARKASGWFRCYFQIREHQIQNKSKS